MIDRQPARFSVNDYLALESASEFRHEYWQGYIFDMTGGSPFHSLIGINVAREFSNRLLKKGCLTFNNDMCVKTPTATYAYPDFTALCGKPLYITERGVTSLINPQLLVEVLSPTTAKYDQTDKFDEYSSIPEFNTYLLIWQDRPLVELRTRVNEDTWQTRRFEGLEAVMPINTFDIEIPLADLYLNVNWADETG
jgi:Uma2 family endonuclease